ncbi:MAG TPA: hypothetical protein P5158_07865 [Chitinophagaceae bacterium]|nr:hypothetical protein [Chitinophagaceae bacterium]
MKNQRLSILACLFFLISSVPLLYPSFLQVNQLLVRWSVHERLEKEAIETIELSADNIVWIRYNKEIRINNRLFDVKSITCENDSCIVTGIYDDKEDEIINKIHTNETGKQSKDLSSLSQLVSLIFLPCVCQSSTLQNHKPNIPKKYINKTPAIISEYYAVITPPPKHFLHFS